MTKQELIQLMNLLISEEKFDVYRFDSRFPFSLDLFTKYGDHYMITLDAKIECLKYCNTDTNIKYLEEKIQEILTHK